MTYLATTKLPDLWVAGVAIVGITDREEMHAMSDAAFRSFKEMNFGRPKDNAELYRDRSAIQFVENLRAPPFYPPHGERFPVPAGARGGVRRPIEGPW